VGLILFPLLNLEKYFAQKPFLHGLLVLSLACFVLSCIGPCRAPKNAATTGFSFSAAGAPSKLFMAAAARKKKKKKKKKKRKPLQKLLLLLLNKVECFLVAAANNIPKLINWAQLHSKDTHINKMQIIDGIHHSQLFSNMGALLTFVSWTALKG
jgi:hypothetical protein